MWQRWPASTPTLSSNTLHRMTQNDHQRAVRPPFSHSGTQSQTKASLSPPGYVGHNHAHSRPALKDGGIASRLDGVLVSDGQPMDAETKRFMERRFDYDFARVRIHSDSRAGATADNLGAHAYTVGDHIVFARGTYSPRSVLGQTLLAHELAHVIQQRRASQSLPTQLAIGDAADPAEHEADRAAHAVGLNPLLDKSPALGNLVQSSLSYPTLQRAIKRVPTWAGEFLLDNYDAVVGATNPNVNGADITMHFHPNDLVDAQEIAFIQSARSLVDNKPYTKDYNDTAKQSVAESRNVTKGEVGQGSHIDQWPSSRTPLAGMKKESGDALAGPEPNKKYTDIGFHFTDDKGVLQKNDAMLHDEPNLVQEPTIEQGQEFESAAVAIKGNQQGVYYGSVEWGWFKYPSQKNPQLIEFKAKSKDAPSAVFQKAAAAWNTSLTSEKKAPIHVPGMSMYLTSATTKLLEAPEIGKEIGTLEKNVRVGLTDEREAKSPSFWLNVVVVSGRLAGKRGWLTGTAMKSDNDTGKPAK